MSNHKINAAEMAVLLQSGQLVHILDVREAIEFHTFNIGGTNLPLSLLPGSINQLTFGKTEPVIVICKAGLRSKTAQSILLQNGYANVRNLHGGLIALQKLNNNTSTYYKL